MSKAFGPIFQMAYVVEDIEAHIDHWTGTMGVGPFFRFPLPLPLDWLEVRGQSVPVDSDIYASVVIGFSGDMMIELIQPGSAPSCYREFLASGRTGVHHVGTFTDSYDAQMKAAREAGIGVALEGALPLSRFAYLDTDVMFPGTMVEIIEPKQAMLDLFEEIKAAARAWDGKERVRQM